jgi:outer membrane autotransporter protein
MSDNWDGVNEIYDGDNDGVSFGLGLDYGVTENISVFTDYVNYLRNYGGTNSQWGANLGLKYNF